MHVSIKIEHLVGSPTFLALANVFEYFKMCLSFYNSKMYVFCSLVINRNIPLNCLVLYSI